jgi:hypothetical protein
MPRTSYKAVFIREIDELLTIAYIFELLFDQFDLIYLCLPFDREIDSEWNMLNFANKSSLTLVIITNI